MCREIQRNKGVSVASCLLQRNYIAPRVPHLLSCNYSSQSQPLNGPASTQLERTSLDVDGQDKTVAEDPLSHPDFFNVADLVSTKDLFDARVHLGHNKGVRNPEMTPYIFGTRLKTDIIDLDQTLPLLRYALNVTAHIAFRAGVIMFVSRHQQTLPIVEKTALECGEFSHCREWKGGTFTNANVQFNAITRLPDLVIFLSTHDTVFEQHKALVESAKLNIPTVGILDTSCDPSLVTYPVPGNDDSAESILLYCHLFKQAILLGKEKRKELISKGLLE